jgi:hypothetical protein
MIEWLSVLVSPIVGAGAGSIFKKWLHKSPDAKSRPVPTGTLGTLSRDVADLQEWQEEARTLLMAQERRLRKLQQEIRVTRLILDVFLVLVLLLAST